MKVSDQMFTNNVNNVLQYIFRQILCIYFRLPSSVTTKIGKLEHHIQKSLAKKKKTVCFGRFSLESSNL